MKNSDEKRGKVLDSLEKIEQPEGNKKDEANTELRKQFEALHLSPQTHTLQAKNASSFYSALDTATTALKATGSEAETKSQAEKVLSSREKKENTKSNSR